MGGGCNQEPLTGIPPPQAAKANAKDQVIFKKTWKIHHHGTYNKKTKFVSNDGQDLKPPPPRRLSALLRS